MSKVQSISFPEDFHKKLSEHPRRKDFRSFSAFVLQLLAEAINETVPADFMPGRASCKKLSESDSILPDGYPTNSVPMPDGSVRMMTDADLRKHLDSLITK